MTVTETEGVIQEGQAAPSPADGATAATPAAPGTEGTQTNQIQDERKEQDGKTPEAPADEKSDEKPPAAPAAEPGEKQPPGPVPYARFAEVNALKNQFEQRVAEVETEMRTTAARLQELEPVSELVERVRFWRKFDPQLEEFLKTHPAFTGEPARREHFQSDDEYNAYRDETFRQEVRAEIEETQRRQERETFEEKVRGDWRSEIEKMRGDQKVFSKILTPERIDRVYKHISKVAKAMSKGDDIPTIEGVTRSLFHKEIAELERGAIQHDTEERLRGSVNRELTRPGEPPAPRPKEIDYSQPVEKVIEQSIAALKRVA